MIHLHTPSGPAVSAQARGLSGAANGSPGAGVLHVASPESVQRTHLDGQGSLERGAAQLSRAAMLRMLDRRDAGFRE